MKSISKTVALTSAGVLIAAAGTVTGLELSNTTYWFHDKPIPTVKINGGQTVSANPNVPSSKDKSSASGPTNLRGIGQPTTGTYNDSLMTENRPGQIDSGIKPKQPIGQFVSNHYPASNDENEISVCTTSPGAKCQIVFTKGIVKKSLSALVTNGNGSVSWNWTPKAVGLSGGKWQVTAIASNGNITANQKDKILLEVK